MAAAGVLHAPPVEACSPWEPALERTFPPAGGELPEGAALLLYGHVIVPDHLTVTLDGVPAELHLLPERSRSVWFFLWGQAFETIAVQIEPTPQVGQTVVVTGDPCLQDEGIDCDEVELVYTVTEPDVDLPDAPIELYYDTYDHGSVATSYTSCGNSSAQYELSIHTEIGREILEFPLEYRLLRRPRAQEDGWGLVEHGWLLDEDDKGPWLRWKWLLEEVEGVLPLAEAYCLRFETADASDNLGGALEVCPPCHDQFGAEDGGGSFLAWPDGLPPYTDASIVPDGYCPQSVLDDTDGTETGLDDSDGGATTTGTSGSLDDPTTGAPDGETDGDAPTGQVQARGCGCTAGRSDPMWLAGWAIFVIVARRRAVPC